LLWGKFMIKIIFLILFLWLLSCIYTIDGYNRLEKYTDIKYNELKNKYESIRIKNKYKVLRESVA